MESSLTNINNDSRNNKKRNRTTCNICNKKLPFYTIKCKCDKLFCNIHRNFADHDCKYDYKTESKKRLETELTNNAKQVKKQKVEKI